jgi:hypothetical protein
MTLTTAGASRNISVVNSSDPTATGNATITVTAAAAAKLVFNEPADFTPGNSRAAYTVTITDAYGNPVNAASNLTVTLSAIPGASSSTFYDASSAGNIITSVTIPSGSSSANFFLDATAAASYTVTGSAPSSGYTDATDEIIAGFVWEGDISTDWNTPGNWEGNAVPANWATVIIPQALPHKPVLDQNRNVGDIFIGENLTVTLNGFTLTIGGALTGSGSFIGSATSGLNITDAPSPASAVALGTLYFDQTTNGTTNKLSSLIINRSQSGAVANLGNNVQVTTLRLEDGIIDIGDATMTITGLDPSHVGDANSYVRTSGIGFLKNSIANGGGSLRFPVGNSAFNPVTLTNNTSVSPEEFGVQVIDEVYLNGTGRGNQALANRRRVTRTWEITKASSGNANGTGVGFAFQWNVNETFGSGFDVNNLAMFHHDRTTWSPQTGTVTRDGNTRTMTFSGYLGSFSPFSLQDQTGTLPVVWGGFTAKAEGSNVQLNWSTVTEIDSKDFVVQHSVDGIRWSDIGIVVSNGNSRLRNDYAFTHSTPAAGNNYYRLMERSFTGAVQFSSIVSVNMPLSGKLIIFGNPVTNGILKFSLPKSANVTLNDVQGRILYRGKMEAGIQQIDLQGKPSGLYYLKAGSAQRTVLIN